MSCLLAVTSPDYVARFLEFFSFEYAFTLNALLASMLVGALCGVVGTFLVLRGMSLIGDATGHATLPGVGIGFLVAGGTKSMGVLLVGALVSGLLATLLVGVISRGARSRPDAAIGVVLSVFFGFGIVLLSYIQSSPTGAQAGLNRFLYGNAAGVDAGQLAVLAVLAAVVLGLVVIFWRYLVVSVFDRTFALSIGMPATAVYYGLLVALSVAVVVSIQAVGVVLVSAMLIIPASTSLFFCKRMVAVAISSAVLGLVAGAGGAVASYMFEGVSTGPAMVLVAGAMFVVALLLGPRGGLVIQGIRGARRRAEVAHG